MEIIPENESDKYSTNDIGFIEVMNKKLDLVPGGNGDSNFQISDDKDSNAENYYQMTMQKMRMMNVIFFWIRV